MVLSALAQLAQVAAVSGTLLTTPVAMPGVCRMTQAPVINIIPKTAPIQYDMSKTSTELTMLQSGTISPYGLNVDQTTGGFRHDKPYMTYKIKHHILQDPNSGSFCMAYGQIDVTIQLQPKIYIAKEYNTGQCGTEVKKHEQKHVQVDRYIINKYAKQMGVAVQKAVNAAGVIGPFAQSQTQAIQQSMKEHITSALSSVELLMMNEMNHYQQAVDSREEYDRVSQYCEGIAEKVMDARKKNDASKR